MAACWIVFRAVPCVAQTALASSPRRAPDVAVSPTVSPVASPTVSPVASPAESPTASRAVPPQRAEDSSSEPGASGLARFLLERGKERFNRGILERRREELERAFDVLSLGRALELDPAFSINAARVARELGRCQEARLLYQSLVDRSPASVHRPRVEQRLAELGSCEPAELTEATSVLPGQALWVSVPAPWRDPPPPLRWAELTTSPAEPAPTGPRLLSWGLLGAAGASTLASAIFIAQAASRDQELEGLRPDPANPEASSRRSAQLKAAGRAAQTRAHIFGAVAAGLGVAGGVVLWLSSRSSESGPSAVLLQASSDGAGASWQRRF